MHQQTPWPWLEQQHTEPPRVNVCLLLSRLPPVAPPETFISDLGWGDKKEDKCRAANTTTASTTVISFRGDAKVLQLPPLFFVFSEERACACWASTSEPAVMLIDRHAAAGLQGHTVRTQIGQTGAGQSGFSERVSWTEAEQCMASCKLYLLLSLRSGGFLGETANCMHMYLFSVVGILSSSLASHFISQKSTDSKSRVYLVLCLQPYETKKFCVLSFLLNLMLCLTVHVFG